MLRASGKKLEIGANLLDLMGPRRGLPVQDGLVAWYDAADLATITDAGAGAVSSWTDKSGNGNDLSEATNRPTTGARTIGGLNAINFDGTNDKLSSSCPADDRTSTTFAVGELDTVSAYRTLWGSNNTGGDCLRIEQFTGVWQNEAQGVAGITTFAFGPGTATPFVVGMIYSANAYAFDMNDDAAYLVRTANAQAFTAGRTLVLGASASTFFWDGAIGEIIRYNRTLRPSEAGKVLAYLRAKWGIA